MEELHFLSDEEKIKRLDKALDKAIEIISDSKETLAETIDCPMGHPSCGECVYPDKWKTCDPLEDGYDCWRWYLTH